MKQLFSTIILLVLLLGGCATTRPDHATKDRTCTCTTVEEYNLCVTRYNTCREILSKVVADSRDCLRSIDDLQNELRRQERRSFWLRVRDGALSFLGGFGIAALIFLL